MTGAVGSPDSAGVLDVLGVGIGPFNLSLAALAATVPGLSAACCERAPEFRWHPGLMIEGATVQVPFLADLVSLVAPAHPLSFLNFLAEHDRLFPFYFAERLHLDRVEYDAYCRWASGRLPGCRFGHDVRSVRWSPADGAFHACADTSAGPVRLAARNIVLGVGTEPAVPPPLRALAADPAAPVAHAGDYLANRADLVAARETVVIGSGQSGAEVFLDLLRRRPPGRERLRWLARTRALAPMEYSTLGLEHFTPDHTAYFHSLPEPVRTRLVAEQWQLYKGISAGTIAEIQGELYRRSVHCGWPDVTITPGVEVTAARMADGRVELDVAHGEAGRRDRVLADGVVLATGYRERPVDDLLGPLADRLRRDAAGRPVVCADHRLDFEGGPAGSVFVQNAERHTHGVGAPDLGLGAWRAATILNAILGRQAYRLPARTAFTTFGLPVGGQR